LDLAVGAVTTAIMAGVVSTVAAGITEGLNLPKLIFPKPSVDTSA
jgi:hypothetical protein